MATTVAVVSEEEAWRIVSKHPSVKMGSRKHDGRRRLVTSAKGDELRAVRSLINGVSFGSLVDSNKKSVPILSPGIRDPMPCVTCHKTKNREWAELSATINEHEILLKHFAIGKIPIPEAPILKGSGIVYVGGGKYWPGVVVGIRMLRETGCSLPVQVWHRGPDEPVNPEDVAGLDVTIIDTASHAIERGGARILGGWESKLWAIAHCGFEKILYLDADAYVVSDPTALINVEGAPFRFWRDLPSAEKNVKWNKVWRRGNSGVPQVQGGQLLIDVQRAWKLICIAHWMNQHSDFYYKHMFGDQDTWRVALAAIGDVSLWEDLGAANWTHPAFVIPSSQDPMIVHRCRSKLFDIDHIPNWTKKRNPHTQPHYFLPKEVEVFNHLAAVLRTGDSAAVFPKIYDRKIWGLEDPSGAGSSEQESQPWVDFVNAEIGEDRFNTVVVDLGSGSGRVLKQIRCLQSFGVDVCESLVAKLRAESRDDGRAWLTFDFFKDRESIPSGDVLLIKDVLHHWPNWMVVEFLEWLSESCERWGKVFLCSDRNQVSEAADCHLGGYRALSHRMSPLSMFPVKLRGEFLHKEILEFGDC